MNQRRAFDPFFLESRGKVLQFDNAFERAVSQEKAKNRERYRTADGKDQSFLRAINEEACRLLEKEAELAAQPGHDEIFDDALQNHEMETLRTIEATAGEAQAAIDSTLGKAQVELTTKASEVKGIIESAKTAAASEVKIAVEQATKEILETTKIVLEAHKEAEEKVQKIITSGQPVLETTKPRYRARDWQIDFGPMFGPAGFVTAIRIPPQCLFRSEKIIANDTGEPSGHGTRILEVSIGQRLQRPASPKGGTLTAFFSETALGNGIRWDTCPEYSEISVTVSFVQQCTFDMTLFGKAVV